MNELKKDEYLLNLINVRVYEKKRSDSRNFLSKKDIESKMELSQAWIPLKMYTNI